jgi:hypothetical protein
MSPIHVTDDRRREPKEITMRDAARTAQLVLFAVQAMALTPIVGTGLEGKKLRSLYQTPDGRRVLVRTRIVKKKRNLLGAATGSDWNDRLGIEECGCDFVLAVFGEKDGTIACYLIPVAELAQAYRVGHRWWQEQHPGRGDNTREIIFDDRVDGPRRGYAVKFDQYRLDLSGLPHRAPAAATRPALDNPDSLAQLIGAAKLLLEAAGLSVRIEPVAPPAP